MAKTKISITISRALLEKIDREAGSGEGRTRSSVIEEWLRRAARSRAADVLREETVAYYDSVDAGENEEADAISRAAGEAARRLRYDE
jgi:metal-responsive CopG/Arc/MetJ family transcriptional regulator